MLLCQPADQRHAASFCAAEEHNTADSVKVVEVGTRGRARRAQTATRCPTWVRGACWCSGSPAARWTGTRYFVVSELQETSHCVSRMSCTCVENSPDPERRSSVCRLRSFLILFVPRYKTHPGHDRGTRRPGTQRQPERHRSGPGSLHSLANRHMHPFWFSQGGGGGPRTARSLARSSSSTP